jgi:hypothetical protein
MRPGRSHVGSGNSCQHDLCCEDAAFAISDAASLTKRRSQAVWRAKDGPGAWLTHGRRPVPVETGKDDTAFEALLEDIVQVAGEST